MQRYFSKTKKDDKLILNSDDLHHIYKVMRMKNNDLIEVIYDEELYICYLDGEEALIKEKKENSKLDYEINLVIPLLKETKMDLIIQKATELGVSKIIPVKMERSIVKIDNKEEKKLLRWKKIAKEAAEQSKRINIPEISNVLTLKDLNEIDGLKIVCSTKPDVLELKNILHNNLGYDRITIVIGPEGGISNYEEKLLNDIGFISVSLGKLIMRVETVPMYILSVLNFMKME